MKRQLAVMLILLMAAGCATAPAKREAGSAVAVPPIDFRSRTLANGLTVYALHDPTTPNVAVSMYYDVGAKHDPEGRSGFAHLFEHLLSRKTVNMTYNVINRMVEEVGGMRNANTSYDRTRYFEIVPAQYLETMLWTHAERMARPVLDQAVLDNERMAVNQEYHEFTITPPYAQLYRLIVPENAFDTVPHRRPVIGKMSDLASASLDDALGFHEAYYGPDTATLVVSGNFDPARLDGWIDRYLAPIPRRPRNTSLKIAVAEPPRTTPRLVNAYATNIVQPAIATHWKMPPYAHRDVAVIDVLDAVLTRGRNSRLYRAMIEKGLATQTVTSFNDYEEIGSYGIVAMLAAGASLEEAERVLAAELARMRAEPVSDAELAEAKNELVASSLRQRETYSNRATEMAEALVRSGDPRMADKRVAQIQSVTAADVQRVARQYLAPEARVDFRYRNETERPAGDTSTWTNPVPMPKFTTVPPATRPPHQAADDAHREAPPKAGQPVPVSRPAIAESKLANGLTVVAARTTNVPLATMTLVLNGGASTDPAGRSGVAALAAELAPRGTTNRTGQQIAAEIESLGATISSSADPDGTVISITAPAANLAAAGRVLADVARNAAIPQDELEKSRRRALDRVAVAMKEPSQVAAMVAQRALYGAAPYGNVPSGTATSLQALTHADVVQHVRDWWHPANAALVIAGGIDAAAATQLAQTLFASWPSAATPKQPPLARAGQGGARRTIVVDIPNAPQTAVVVGLRGVERGDASYYATIVANSFLGVGTTSRLFEEIRSKRGLSYSMGSWMPERFDEAVLTGWAQTKSERAPELLEVLLREFGRMASEPLPAAAIENRKALITGLLDRQSETSASFAGLVAGLIRQGLPPAEATRYAQTIQGLRAEDVTRAAQRLFAPEATTVVVAGDASKVVEPLRAAGRDVEVIRIDDLDLDVPALRR